MYKNAVRLSSFRLKGSSGGYGRSRIRYSSTAASEPKPEQILAKGARRDPELYVRTTYPFEDQLRITGLCNDRDTDSTGRNVGCFWTGRLVLW